MENNKLLNRLSQLFLKTKDPDKDYFNISMIIKRLNNRGIEISVKEVQKKAYGHKG